MQSMKIMDALTIDFDKGWLRALEFVGAGLAMFGTFLMATGVLRDGNALAWGVWLAGSALLCMWSVRRGAWGVFTMNLVYIAFDLYGLARALGVLS